MKNSKLWKLAQKGKINTGDVYTDQEGNQLMYTGNSFQLYYTKIDITKRYVGMCLNDTWTYSHNDVFNMATTIVKEETDMGWGISDNASLKEKIKSEMADHLQGLNATGAIDASDYSETFDVAMDLLDQIYELGKKEGATHD